MGNDTFLGMLAESPFTGLQEHMKIGNKTSKELQRFLKAVSKNDWKEAKECRKEIVSLENQADLHWHPARQIDQSIRQERDPVRHLAYRPYSKPR